MGLRDFVNVGEILILSVGVDLRYGLMQWGWVLVIKNRKFDKLYVFGFLMIKKAKSGV